jgi:small subunit ribosomal protein S20
LANVPSAEKRNRQRIKRRARNLMHLTATRTQIKKAAQALAGKDTGAAQEKVQDAEKQLARAAQKGVIKKATASRKISRLQKALNKLTPQKSGT